MQVLDVNEAAKLLHMSEQTLREKAKAGIIPGQKPGKRWIFSREHLIAWIGQSYTKPRQDVGQGEQKCYTEEKTVQITGTSSLLTDSYFKEVLEQVKRMPPKG